jgi:hypothetical protein
MAAKLPCEGCPRATGSESLLAEPGHRAPGCEGKLAAIAIVGAATEEVIIMRLGTVDVCGDGVSPQTRAVHEMMVQQLGLAPHQPPNTV